MTIDLKLFLPIVISIFSILAVALLIKAFKFSKKGRRSPLTRDLLRGPGETLREAINDLNEDVSYYLAVLFFMPLVCIGLYSLSGGKGFSLEVMIVAALVIMVFSFFKLWRLLRKRTSLRLGLDCEQAIGQELNHLMLEGYRVYHDFPADGFNIDHVVVGPKGILAVETKGRAKPTKRQGLVDAKVIYDGERLKFPGWSEGAPIEQTKRQAKWLSEWLSSATGDRISAQPVLALPGWFISNESPSEVLLYNGKFPNLVRNMRDERLSPDLVQRAIHQIEQRCRDVEPTAYKQEKNRS